MSSATDIRDAIDAAAFANGAYAGASAAAARATIKAGPFTSVAEGLVNSGCVLIVEGTPADGDVPVWNDALQQWEPGAGGGGGGTPSGTVAAETALGIASAAGASSTYSRGDHTHGSPTAATIATGLASYFQPLDAGLTSLITVDTGADLLPYTTGANAWAATALTSFARTLLDDVNDAAMRTTLGLVIGTHVQAYSAELAAVAALATTGWVKRTGAATYTTATPTAADVGADPAGTAGSEVATHAALTTVHGISAFGATLVDDANAAAARTTLGLGNVENTALSTWAGTANITTVGTIATGVWSGTAIAVAKGGTGLTALGSPLQVLRVDGAGTALEYVTSAPLTDGGKGDITVSATGATWTIEAGAVTYAKMQNVSATDRLLGRSTAGAGAVEEIVCTSAGRALLDDVDAAAQRSTLSLGALATLAAVDIAQIVDQAVTLAKMANVATARIFGRVTADSGVPEALTGTQATTLLDVFTSALKGLVPASGGGTANFLRADGVFAAPTASLSATTVEVDLGSDPVFRGKFTITDAAISGTSKVLVWQAPGPYTGKGTRADEAEMQPVQIIATEPAAGSAVVKWQTPPWTNLEMPGAGGSSGAARPSAPIIRRGGLVRGAVKFSYTIAA